MIPDPFAIMTMLFLLWGFMTVFNDIFIPRFRFAAHRYEG